MLIQLSGEGPRYLQIYQGLRESILEGRLGPGSRLPASRVLAEDLGFSRNVVLVAYDQLMAEGYTEASVGSGTYVARALPEDLLSVRTLEAEPEGPESSTLSGLSNYGARLAELPGVGPEDRHKQQGLPYDFRYGTPNVADFPHEIWKRQVLAVLRGTTLRALKYGPPEGDPELREALAGYLSRSRGVRCRPDQIVVVNGSQQGLDLVTRVLIDEGDSIVLEDPHYLGARDVFVAAGARLLALDVDKDGLDTSRLASISDAKLAYVTPSHQFPTGELMSAARRLELLDWAKNTGAYILEDDYDSEFRYRGRPLQAVQGLDSGQRVIYCGTLSKVLFPSVRLGYLVLPPSLLHVVRKAKQLSDGHSPMLLQQVVSRFISEGHFERHLRRARRANAQRRLVLLQSLEEHLGGRVDVAGENAGIHMLVWLRGALNADEVVAAAFKNGVGLYPVAPYYVRQPPGEGLLLGYASLTERQIREGVEILGKILK